MRKHEYKWIAILQRKPGKKAGTFLTSVCGKGFEIDMVDAKHKCESLKAENQDMTYIIKEVYASGCYMNSRKICEI